MPEPQKINLNKFELKLADTNDPVALKLNWNPLVRGSSGFESHKLAITESTISVRSSRSLVLRTLTVLCVCLFLMAFFAQMLFSDNTKYSIIALSVIFSAFLIIAVVEIRKGKKSLTFNKLNGHYYRGREFEPARSKKRQDFGSLSDIYALQIIQERIEPRSNRQNPAPYTGYEVNLVFKDGFRVNVIDHGDLESILKSAKQLAEFINVPIWQAAY